MEWKLAATCLFAVLSCLTGCVEPAQQAAQTPETSAVQVEYYYFPSCESCQDGEAFADRLEAALSDAMEPEDYALTLKNIAVSEYQAEFQQIVDQVRTDTYYPSAPFLLIDDRQLIGQSEIDASMRTAMIEAHNARTNQAALREEMEDIPAENAYFIYFYKSDCPYCEKAEAYLSRLDKVQYRADGTPSPLQIQYVDLNRADYMELAAALFDRYDVPEDKRFAPTLLWKDGCFSGYNAIFEGMQQVLSSGQACQWPGLSALLHSDERG